MTENNNLPTDLQYHIGPAIPVEEWGTQLHYMTDLPLPTKSLIEQLGRVWANNDPLPPESCREIVMVVANWLEEGCNGTLMGPTARFLRREVDRPVNSGTTQ